MEWKQIRNGDYDVTPWGHVRDRRLRTLKAYISVDGYWFVNLLVEGQRKHVKVHILVAEAFIGPRPEGLQINHKDGVKTNNHISNLEYCTAQENRLHAIRTGLVPLGADAPHAKQTESQVTEYRRRWASGESAASLAAEAGMSKSAMYQALKGLKWKHLEAGHGPSPSLSKSPVKLTKDAVRSIRQRAANGETGVSIARDYGVHPTTIQRAISGTRWKNVEPADIKTER